MAKQKIPTAKAWFESCSGYSARHDLDQLRSGIKAGLLDEQDEHGMTALSLAVMSKWEEGVKALLKAGADTELRHFRTGETALYMATQQRNEPAVKALVRAGANPDAANYWGMTPRAWSERFEADYFKGIRARKPVLPPPRIQNAERLADHHHPKFKIPSRAEREALEVGQAVGLYVYGPKSATKQDAVKVRITERSGQRSKVRYTAAVETPLAQTHLTPDMMTVEFGPENVASVYVAKPARKKSAKRA